MIPHYCIEDLLQPQSKQDDYVGYLNLFCNEQHVALVEQDQYLLFNSQSILIKLHALLKNGYASIFFKYKFYTEGLKRIWGLQHLILCLFQHEKSEKYGSYLCQANPKKPELIIPFWFKGQSSFKLAPLGFVIEEYQPDLMDSIYISTDTCVLDLEKRWKNYSVEAFEHPFFRNIFYLLMLSSFGHFSSFRKELLNTSFQIVHIIDFAKDNFPSFLSCIDRLINELGFEKPKKLSDAEFCQTDLNDLSESYLSELALEMTSWLSTKSALTAEVGRVSENAKVMAQANDDIDRGIHSTSDLDISTYHDLRHYFRDCCVHYATRFFVIEKLEPLQGFYIGFIAYIEENLEKHRARIEAVQLNYLRYEILFSMVYILSKNYVYKFMSDNFLALLKEQSSYPRTFVALLNSKIRSIVIFLKNKFERITLAYSDDFKNFSIFQIIFYYLRYYSEFIVEIKLGIDESEAERLEQKYSLELDKISNLDLSFFYYLTEHSPRQIYLIKD